MRSCSSSLPSLTPRRKMTYTTSTCKPRLPWSRAWPQFGRRDRPMLTFPCGADMCHSMEHTLISSLIRGFPLSPFPPQPGWKRERDSTLTRQPSRRMRPSMHRLPCPAFVMVVLSGHCHVAFFLPYLWLMTVAPEWPRHNCAIQ
ncbi:hypothetical protein LX32DRAFT_463990 [Colletotrichum zoysiae]|uniref:Uncharacterized protein n=1 Tax=Colletotrichum zoysiae TaxID=1216348 RepID=A0AAD9HEL3_9PEZI|nr:hypothetical protein LX32DRAFT_463990 [Colletotrichum zoysiae]